MTRLDATPRGTTVSTPRQRPADMTQPANAQLYFPLQRLLQHNKPTNLVRKNAGMYLLESFEGASVPRLYELRLPLWCDVIRSICASARKREKVRK